MVNAPLLDMTISELTKTMLVTPAAKLIVSSDAAALASSTASRRVQVASHVKSPASPDWLTVKGTAKTWVEKTNRKAKRLSDKVASFILFPPFVEPKC